MVGFPQETEVTLNDTIKAICSIPCDTIIYSIFTPYPGTELFNYCKEKEIINDDFDVALFNHHSPLNYFSVNIPKEVFIKILRQLEIDIDRINAIKQIKKYFSYEGYLRFKEKGFSASMSRLKSFMRTLLN